MRIPRLCRSMFIYSGCPSGVTVPFLKRFPSLSVFPHVTQDRRISSCRFPISLSLMQLQNRRQRRRLSRPHPRKPSCCNRRPSLSTARPRIALSKPFPLHPHALKNRQDSGFPLATKPCTRWICPTLVPAKANEAISRPFFFLCRNVELLCSARRARGPFLLPPIWRV